ncbi:MAG: hypothetical protein ACRDL0_06615 [Thermoleophilaceae bacterium]
MAGDPHEDDRPEDVVRKRRGGIEVERREDDRRDEPHAARPQRVYDRQPQDKATLDLGRRSVRPRPVARLALLTRSVLIVIASGRVDRERGDVATDRDAALVGIGRKDEGQVREGDADAEEVDAQPPRHLTPGDAAPQLLAFHGGASFHVL